MVAMNVWPTDAADGSVASEARWRKMGRLWCPSGVANGVGGSMVPTLAMPNLTVKSGACWVDGHYCELVGDQVLAVTANGIAVVRFDPAANTAELLWRDAVSVPAQSPTGTWEELIASTSGSVMADRRSFVNPKQGLVSRTVKGTTEAGYDTNEFVISGLVGFPLNPLPNRWTTTKYGIILPVVTQPSVASWVYIRLRLGTTVAGALVESHVFPWAPGQQSFGANIVALRGEFAPLGVSPGAVGSLTIQCGTGMSTSVGSGSWVSTTDEGSV